MENFTFYSPTCFVFGKDAENQAGALVKRFGGSRVLIHYGGGSAVRSGLIGRVRVWGCQMDFARPEETAKEGIRKLKEFFTSIGMPRNFAELGAKEEDIPALVHTLCRGDGRQGSISGFVTLNEEDCEKIYRLMI